MKGGVHGPGLGHNVSEGGTDDDDEMTSGGMTLQESDDDEMMGQRRATTTRWVGEAGEGPSEAMST